MFETRTDHGFGGRVRAHIRNHVVGYVALFVALSGVAYAADGPLPGQNQVGSDDIINGEVYTQDVQLGAIGSGRVADDSIAKVDLAPQSVGYSELDPGAFTFSNDIAGSCNLFCGYGVKNDAIQSNEIQDGQVKSADIENGGVSRSDLAANAKPAGFQTTVSNTGIISNNFDPEGTLPLPRGTFAISAKITVRQPNNQGELLHVTCNLNAEGVQDTSFARVLGQDVFEAGSATATTLPLEALHTFASAGNATVECRDFDIGDTTGLDLKIVAVQVG